MESSSGDILVKSVEKLVRSLAEMREEIKKNREDIADIRRRLDAVEVMAEQAIHMVGAPDELNDYMQEHKNDPGFEVPMTQPEIARRMEEYHRGRRSGH